MDVIPLGGTCSIAYQLKKNNLRNEAYPFDWIRINNFLVLANLIKSNFNNFLNYENFELIEYSENFKINNKFGSYIYSNKICKFYHDFDSKINDKNFLLFKEKHMRRIDRFYEKIKNSKKILFIREEIGNLRESKIKLFFNIISNLNPNLEFKIKVITLNKKIEKINLPNVEIIYSNKKVTDWTRPELNWFNIFQYNSKDSR